MDDSQPPGDIAHALNDRKLAAPLGNYLYRFVSVHLLADFRHGVSSPLWQKYSAEVQPRKSYRRAILRFFSGKHQTSPSPWCTLLFEDVIGRKKGQKVGLRNKRILKFCKQERTATENQELVRQRNRVFLIFLKDLIYYLSFCNGCVFGMLQRRWESGKAISWNECNIV